MTIVDFLKFERKYVEMFSKTIDLKFGYYAKDINHIDRYSHN